MAVQRDKMNSPRNLAYAILALFLLLYIACWVAFAAVYNFNLYFFSYYSVDYTWGFVRRGLGGEILDLFPADAYFTGQLILRWLVPALCIITLAGVACTVALRFGRSERRLMLALLIPMLPFGFAHAVFVPSPELLGGATLAVFAVVLASVKKDRSILIASASYGFTIAVLTFIHEAIPLLLSLGAIAAIVALGVHSSIKVQRLSALLAVIPGLAVALGIGLLGRRNVSSQLCAQLPHGAVDWPPAGNVTLSQSLSGQHYYVDYHDFICRHIMRNFDATLADGIRAVVSVGAVPLIIATLLGAVAFAETVFLISRISGVSFGRVFDVLRGRVLWVASGMALLLPVFAIAADWIRWWVIICFDVGVVYLLFASNQPEAAKPATWRTRLLFSVGVVLLALLPIGAFTNVGIVAPAK